jgi:DNA invertase Pin-like site-specific DNA recombinase
MSRLFAYCRVSTTDQDTDNQVREIEAAGFRLDARRIVTDTVSGSMPAMERTGFRKLVDRLEWDDVLVVTKLDRLGRNAMDVRATVERLAEMKVRVHCLAPGGVDLTSAAGKMTMAVIAAVAEFERDLLIERTQAGLVRAIAQGKKLGRPSCLTPSQQESVRLRRQGGASLRTLAKEFGVTLRLRRPRLHSISQEQSITEWWCGRGSRLCLLPDCHANLKAAICPYRFAVTCLPRKPCFGARSTQHRGCEIPNCGRGLCAAAKCNQLRLERMRAMPMNRMPHSFGARCIWASVIDLKLLQEGKSVRVALARLVRFTAKVFMLCCVRKIGVISQKGSITRWALSPFGNDRLVSWYRVSLLIVITRVCLNPLKAEARDRWTAPQANSWYAKQPWLVGANFITSDAANQIEMWQPETFNLLLIDKEMALAQATGMNTMRVFLHDLLWQQDVAGFSRRIDQFLAIAAKHHIRPLFVIFDSCWDPAPHLGPQLAPVPGVHNSRWLQSPGAAALMDTTEYPRLEAYVKGVIGRFAQDKRILGWDLWNEPDNGPSTVYPGADAKDKDRLVANLLPKVFAWARSSNPMQPLTSGLYKDNDDWSALNLSAFERMQLAQSDVLSFHNYQWPETYEQHIRWLRVWHRPILNTEYMARTVGSTVDQILPIARKYRVGAFNWGLVDGKEQTRYPWDSWDHPYVKSEPAVWLHDLFRKNGTPYRSREIEIIQRLAKPK